jgi:hypothetical protein
VNPQQTASLLSFLTFSYVDGVVWKANRVQHLTKDQLPPPLDRDAAAHLTTVHAHVRPAVSHKFGISVDATLTQAFQHLERVLNDKKEGLFVALCKILKWNLIGQAIAAIVLVRSVI